MFSLCGGKKKNPWKKKKMEGARGVWGMLLQCRILLHLWTLYCSCKWHIAKAELFPEEIQSHLVPEILVVVVVE